MSREVVGYIVGIRGPTRKVLKLILRPPPDLDRTLWARALAEERRRYRRLPHYDTVLIEWRHP